MKPDDALEAAFSSAGADLQTPQDIPHEVSLRLEFVVSCQANRAGVRLLMSCLLAKLENPGVDARMPYTEIGAAECFSGRTYDERYVGPFVTQHQLPCNSTTAFLTPALRNIDSPLTVWVPVVGRPAQLYDAAIQLLDDVENEVVKAWPLLVETVRRLLLLRDENRRRVAALLQELSEGVSSIPLSSENIVTLVEQHMNCRSSSRLPVLVVAAAYEAAMVAFGEHANPLKNHVSADRQTGAAGDVEICIENDDKVVTVYEMKDKPVTVQDIDIALSKIVDMDRLDNYIFITTAPIDKDVADYAASLYEGTGGIEIAVLDCIQFLRHFLHLFHRARIDFLNAYQSLVMAEPASAVSQVLKEAFLALRRAAEIGI